MVILHMWMKYGLWWKDPGPRMCLTSNLAKAQFLESLRPHPTSLASHSPEMLRKAPAIWHSNSKAGHEHCSKNDFGYWDECAGLLWTSEMSVSSVELALIAIRVQRERESHEKRKIKCEFSHQGFQPHQRWANNSVFKYFRIVESVY